MADNNKMLMYKGHPLRRKDNLIYYGSMADKYIVMIQVMSTTKDGGLEIADKVHLQLQLTDPDLKSRGRRSDPFPSDGHRLRRFRHRHRHRQFPPCPRRCLYLCRYVGYAFQGQQGQCLGRRAGWFL